MRIALLTYRGNMFCGGQGIYASYLAREWQKAGHDVHVFALTPPCEPVPVASLAEMIPALQDGQGDLITANLTVNAGATLTLDPGVEVYGVWDQLGAANVSSQDEMLCAAGARIGIENLPGKVHHKFEVIDVEGDDPVVIVGSYNWTNAGAYNNDENTLILHDRELARAYYAEWQTLLAAVLVEVGELSRKQEVSRKW